MTLLESNMAQYTQYRATPAKAHGSATVLDKEYKEQSTDTFY